MLEIRYKDKILQQETPQLLCSRHIEFIYCFETEQDAFFGGGKRYLVCLQDRNSYIVFSKNKNVSIWEKKAPAGALSPSTVLLRGFVSLQHKNLVFYVFIRQTQLFCVSKNKNFSFWERKSPCGSAHT